MMKSHFALTLQIGGGIGHDFELTSTEARELDVGFRQSSANLAETALVRFTVARSTLFSLHHVISNEWGHPGQNTLVFFYRSGATCSSGRDASMLTRVAWA